MRLIQRYIPQPRQLGALPRTADKTRTLAGDEIIPAARYSLNHGIDIEAPASEVWQWLMQLGCDRGGWYSVDRLDHGGVPSVDHLVPEWSERRVGDKLATTPAQDTFYDVLALKAHEHLVIGGATDRLGGHVQMSWAFVLERLGGDATHLVTRVRAKGVPRWSEWLQGAVLFPPLHAVMQHVQLKNLKRLAERQALAR